MKVGKLIHLKEFLEDAKNGNVDIGEFTAKVFSETKKIQKEFSPFITISDNTGELKNGRIFPLPVSVKDCICTKGIRTTAGSKILDGYMPPFDATSVSKVKENGGFVLGKTAQDEFGFGTFSTNCAYSVPKNPYDKERSCGGSSGGAACITAAATFPHVAIAESTGGSITAPAAFTGTVGLTPTYGRISRYGLIDYSNSMDKIGVIGKEVYDVALLFSVISGYDPLDSTSSKIETKDFTRFMENDIKGMKIGIPKEYLEGIDEKIAKNVMEKATNLESLGAELVNISLPLTKFSLPSYYLIAMSEASTNLAKYSGLRYGLQENVLGNFSEYFSSIREKGFGKEAKRRIMLGTYARAAGFREAYYIKALKVRQLIINEFKNAFGKVDVLLAPSMPITAPKFSEIENLTPLQIYNIDKLTTAPNMAGIPTISVPAGVVSGLPVGAQLMANYFNEEKLISVASAIQK